MIVNAGAVQQLQDQKAATQPFIKAVTAKLPQLTQAIAEIQANQTITALDRGVAAFS